MKLLIVDDEVQIRTGLEKGIDWASIGIAEVYAAENGRIALERFQRYRPDVVICDIRMPRMDGMAFIEEAKKQDQECQFIILSGHSEFEYAKKALQFGVMDYELKPVNVERLKSLVIQALERVRDRQSKDSSLRQYWIGKLFEAIVRGKETSTDNGGFARRAGSPEFYHLLHRQLQWGQPGMLRLIRLRIDGHSLISGPDRGLLFELIEKQAAKIPAIFHALSDREIVLLTNPSKLLFAAADWAAELNDRIYASFRMSASIGVSEDGEFDRLPALFESAGDALELMLYRGSRSVGYAHEAVAERARPVASYEFPVQDLEEAYKIASSDRLQACIDEQFAVLAAQRGRTRAQMLEIAERFVDHAKRTMNREQALPIGAAAGLREEALSRCDTIEAMRKAVSTVCMNVHHSIHRSEGTSSSVGILRAIAYIRQNYSKDLTVKEVANTIGQSSNYFSHRFKHDTGVSFTDYMNDLRIEQAKRLLSSTDLMLEEISESIGFRDYKYFTHVFKKRVGQAPSAYRKSGYHRRILE